MNSKDGRSTELTRARREPPHPFSFAMGDWRGKGKQGPRESPEYDVSLVCLKVPGGKGVEMIQFDDDHEGGKVYYAEHLSVADPVRGKMKVTRRGFAYADARDRVFVTHEIATGDGDGVRIAPTRRRGTS